MSELKATTVYDAYWKANSTGEGTGILVCLKSKADKVIEEKDKEIAELKQKLEDAKATAYAESVDAGMRERRLRRALWLARANHADTMQKYNIECKCDGWVHRVNKWVDVERKCLAKMEEYKKWI